MKTAAAEKKKEFPRSAQAAEEAGVSPNTLRLLSAAPQVMENVLGSMLGLELHPPSTKISIPAGRGITASSELRGAWEGVISIHCEKDLAAEIAGKFFGTQAGGLVAENQCCPGKVAPSDGKSRPLNVLWPVLPGNDLKSRGRKWSPERSIRTRHNEG